MWQVSPVPVTTTESELLSIFSPYGTVSSITFPNSKTTGTRLQCAFVVFSSAELGLDAAKELDGAVTLQGAAVPLSIKPAGGEEGKAVLKIYVAKLPRTVDEDELADMFRKFGVVEEAKILKDPVGVSKGCGFVSMTKYTAVKRAIAGLHGSTSLAGAQFPLVVKRVETEQEKNSRKSKAILPVFTATSAGLTMAPQAAPSTGYGGQAYYNQAYYSNLAPQAQQGASMGYYGAAGYQQAGQQVGGGYSAMGGGTAMGMGAGPGLGGGGAGGNRIVSGPPGANLFVYHVPPSFADHDLFTLFSAYGNVIGAKVIIDLATGASKGFGFVNFDSAQSAQRAIAQTNGMQVTGGKRLKVEVKTDKAKPY